MTWSHLYLVEFGLAVVTGVPQPFNRLFGVDSSVLLDQEIRRFRYAQHSQYVDRHPQAARQVQLVIIQKVAEHVRVQDAGHDEQLVQTAEEPYRNAHELCGQRK